MPPKLNPFVNDYKIYDKDYRLKTVPIIEGCLFYKFCLCSI